jgi:hypothetical protein
LAAGAAAATTAIIWRTKLAIVREALRDASPEERPIILKSLRGIFKSDFELGPLKRRPPLENPEDEPKKDEPKPDDDDEKKDDTS